MRKSSSRLARGGSGRAPFKVNLVVEILDSKIRKYDKKKVVTRKRTMGMMAKTEKSRCGEPPECIRSKSSFMANYS